MAEERVHVVELHTLQGLQDALREVLPAQAHHVRVVIGRVPGAAEELGADHQVLALQDPAIDSTPILKAWPRMRSLTPPRPPQTSALSKKFTPCS